MAGATQWPPAAADARLCPLQVSIQHCRAGPRGSGSTRAGRRWQRMATAPLQRPTHGSTQRASGNRPPITRPRPVMVMMLPERRRAPTSAPTSVCPPIEEGEQGKYPCKEYAAEPAGAGREAPNCAFLTLTGE